MSLSSWRSTACLLVIGFCAAADAQPTTPSASTVLANVQQYYSNANHLTALFRQAVTNAAFGTKHTSDGKLWVAKPDKFRFDYLQKKGKLTTIEKTFAFDGTTLWYIDHPSKQIYQQQAQSGALPAAVSFLTNASALSTQFNVAIVGQSSQTSGSLILLGLTPKQPSAQYKQLSFVVNTADWHVTGSTVVEPNGDTNEFNFYTPDLQSSVAAQWFEVDPSKLPAYKLVSNAGSGSSSAVPAPASAAPPGSSP